MVSWRWDRTWSVNRGWETYNSLTTVASRRYPWDKPGPSPGEAMNSIQALKWTVAATLVSRGVKVSRGASAAYC